jgi:hypothetical protein
MKAWKVPYGSKVTVTDEKITTPPGAKGIRKGDVIIILRLDGMYVNATDKHGDRIYISAWTEVEL